MPFCHSFRICPQHAVAPYRCFSDTQIQYRYTPDTEVILIFIQNSNTVPAQIRSRHRRHSFSHTNSIFKYSYSSDTLQTRRSFFCSYKFSPKIQFKYIPDTDTILIFILLTRHTTVQQTFHMASLIPSPTRFCHSSEGIFNPISKWHL